MPAVIANQSQHLNLVRLNESYGAGQGIHVCRRKWPEEGVKLLFASRNMVHGGGNSHCKLKPASWVQSRRTESIKHKDKSVSSKVNCLCFKSIVGGGGRGLRRNDSTLPIGINGSKTTLNNQWSQKQPAWSKSE
jgi:hypothetical protein